MTTDLMARPPAGDTANTPLDHMIQFVAPDGALTPEGIAAGVDVELGKTLYRDMVLARALDRAAVALQRQGELSLWLQCEGQEAAQVGSIRAIRDTDHVFPSYREHAAGLARGLSPAQLMTQWRGIAHAGWDPQAHGFHFYSLVLGTQTLHATGYALGNKLDGDDSVVLVYFGDGAASQGDVSEAMNWAATMALPVVFFCQNNQWAISTPTSKQNHVPIHRRGEGFGLRSWWCDGNDALAVHAVTLEAVESVRRGEGPALIEAETYRIGGHSTSDDPGRYRLKEEVASWVQRDPIARLKAVLGNQGVDIAWLEQVDMEARDLAVATREQCKALEAPRLAELFGEVYAEQHPVTDERLAHQAYLDAVGGDH